MLLAQLAAGVQAAEKLPGFFVQSDRLRQTPLIQHAVDLAAGTPVAPQIATMGIAVGIYCVLR